MLSLNGGYSKSLHNEVMIYCNNNNLSVDYLSYLGDSYHFNISGEFDNIGALANYIHKLEWKRIDYRKSKSFWWRIWN